MDYINCASASEFILFYGHVCSINAFRCGTLISDYIPSNQKCFLINQMDWTRHSRADTREIWNILRFSERHAVCQSNSKSKQKFQTIANCYGITCLYMADWRMESAWTVRRTLNEIVNLMCGDADWNGNVWDGGRTAVGACCTCSRRIPGSFISNWLMGNKWNGCDIFTFFIFVRSLERAYVRVYRIKWMCVIRSARPEKKKM